MTMTARDVELIRACLDDGTYTAQERKDFGALCDLAILALRDSLPQESVQNDKQRAQSSEVDAEVARAVAKFPTWPTDPLHALAVLGEEFGELTKAMLQFTYEPHKTSREEIRTEALQTAAMALRLFKSLDRYEYLPSQQHPQPVSQSVRSETAKPDTAKVPEGWKLVPVEPTDAMVAGGYRAYASRLSYDMARTTYRAMLAAAPSPSGVEESK